MSILDRAVGLGCFALTASAFAIQTAKRVIDPEATDAEVDLLTEAEHQLVYDAGQWMCDLVEIVGHDITRQADLDEAQAHVHALQKMVMGQAAARAYPTRYRLLGERIHG